jgi:hypothetical protein
MKNNKLNIPSGSCRLPIKAGSIYPETGVCRDDRRRFSVDKKSRASARLLIYIYVFFLIVV